MRVSLYDSLRRDIQEGRLAAGEKLPSTRALARRLGISRTTVLEVYEQLALDGLVTARGGSGTRVTAGVHPLRTLVRNAHYPAQPMAFHGPDGVSFYLHR